MAIPKRTKKKTVRGAPRVRRGDKLQAPKWDGWEEWDGLKYHRHRDASRAFYYDNYKPVDLFPHTYKWMAENGYTKEQIKHAKAAPSYELSITAAIIAKQLLDGMPDFNPKQNEYWESLPGTMGSIQPATVFLKARIERAIETGSKVVEVKKQEDKKKENVYVPSIQERIREQAYLQVEAIDEWLEGWLVDPKSFDPKGFDFKKHFQEKGVTQAHARKIKTFYDHVLDDYDELDRMPTAAKIKKMDDTQADLWAQLKEGYAHIKKADIKSYRDAIANLRQALDFLIETAKVTRKPRKTKPKSATKLVEKLKYLKVDDKFKLTSVAPETIIGASELWVFNIKTRKIGKYIASNIDPKGMGRDGTGLSVKGTTIVGFDEVQSIQKTLRKPEEKLKEFKDAGKVKLRTYLESINAVDIKLNGRINPDTVLLKVL